MEYGTIEKSWAEQEAANIRERLRVQQYESESSRDAGLGMVALIRFRLFDETPLERGQRKAASRADRLIRRDYSSRMGGFQHLSTQG